MPTDLPTVTDLINRLFESHPNPETGKKFTDIEITIASRGKIKPSHLHGLRSGRIKNPTRETLLAFCEVFKKDPRYFFPELRNCADLSLD